MKVQGGDCSIVIKTTQKNWLGIPYSEETIREAVSLLQEEAAIEGDGICRAIRKRSGVTGCIVTPLTIGTAPLLLYLAMGSAGLPVFVSETRNLYRYNLDLLPLEDTDSFDLIQDRQGERRFFENCKVQGFELRFNREEAVKLKIDICGERPPMVYPYADNTQSQIPEMSGTATGKERYSGDNVTYKINDKKYSNIYGVTIITKKEGGTKTEIWIKRSLEKGSDIPETIDEIVIEAELLRDNYEHRHFGAFRIKLKRLVLISDETSVNASGAVIAPLRYYVAGVVCADVYSAGNESII